MKSVLRKLGITMGPPSQGCYEGHGTGSSAEEWLGMLAKILSTVGHGWSTCFMRSLLSSICELLLSASLTLGQTKSPACGGH